MRTLSLLLLLFALGAQADSSTGAAGFDRVKDRLIGIWAFIEDGKSYETTFELVSHGQALLERNSGYIAVYHPDGQSIAMTLYTRDGNQPRLRAAAPDQAAESITFAFADITNWKSGTEHVNGLEIVFKDPNHMIEKWEILQPDGKKSRFSFELTRKKD
jgi:hypothetical protein